MQLQQQLEAQQAQHAAEAQEMTEKADHMEGQLRQAADVEHQHVAKLSAHEADLRELRVVSQLRS